MKPIHKKPQIKVRLNFLDHLIWNTLRSDPYNSIFLKFFAMFQTRSNKIAPLLHDNLDEEI